MMNNTNILESLNRLLQRQMEAEKEYLEGLNRVIHAGLKRFLFTQAQSKNTFIHQISSEIQHLGGEIASSEMQNPRYIDWDAILKKDVPTIYRQCIMAEENMLQEYENLIRNSWWGETTLNLLRIQHSEILKSLEQKMEMEESLKQPF
ncbi:DUF2383 domain-containing protein [Robertkochia solimangrovi]|uniref:DUF2383 domain-containing protein n=1 Tax=Robertkochia solimangrovi TaxID=2213046 RepID=UPI0011816BB4|nr:DUF2383 domain-containing protein [Robertkochia solimangrovi]TRZ46413.1 hypothetical protein DMZ48_03965 [Robertkochia solimangrovi]